MKLNFWTLFLFFIITATSTHAETAEPKTLIIDPDQTLLTDKLNWSGEEFFAAFQSKDRHERQLAEMYLAGVLDASEGTTWCGYKILKPITIDETIYAHFKKMPKISLKARASKIILEILSNDVPCKKQKPR